jgi:hypothetical protein
LTRVKKEKIPPIEKMIILDEDNNEIEFEMGFSQETKVHELLSMREGENRERISGISNT